MISITFFANLPERSKSKKKFLELPYEPGTSIYDVLVGEGFSKEDLPHIMAILNGRHVELETRLNDGDSIGVMVAMAGG